MLFKLAVEPVTREVAHRIGNSGDDVEPVRKGGKARACLGDVVNHEGKGVNCRGSVKGPRARGTARVACVAGRSLPYGEYTPERAGGQITGAGQEWAERSIFDVLFPAQDQACHQARTQRVVRGLLFYHFYSNLNFSIRLERV